MDGIRVVNLAAGTMGDSNIPLARSSIIEPPEDISYGTSHPALERSPPISLFVGPQRMHFYIHKDILDKHSSYWRQDLEIYEISKEELVFNDEDSEGYTSISLPDEDPNIVALFLQLIYSTRHEYTIPKFPKFPEQEVFVHAELYLFGEKYGVPILQSFAIKQIHRLLVSYHTARYSSYAARLEFPDRFELIQKTYENTTSPKNELRIMLAMDFAMRWGIYRKEGLKDGDIDESSELARLFRAVPAFERDLLMCLGNSALEVLPPPGVSETLPLPGVLVMNATAYPLPDSPID